MNVFSLLKAQWELLGLNAPAFSWLASAGIIIYFFWVYLRQRQESKNRQRAYLTVNKKLKSLLPGTTIGTGSGITRRAYSEIDKIFTETPILHAPWQAISSLIVNKNTTTGEERYWVSEDAGTIFNANITVENQNYRNAPAIITGVGLLATFLAILVALLDMRIVNNRIQGLDLLIHGLSGKFLSSVVAVACATLLTGAEKSLFQPVKLYAASLSMTLRRLLPRLSSTQILLDLHADIVEESRILKKLSSELSVNLSRGLTEAVGPAMEKMAVRFNESLTDATRGQFGQIAESLGATALLLQGMNSQFNATGTVLNELMSLAKSTVTDEAAHHENHIQQMTTVVGDIVGKLQDHAGESVDYMEKAMAAITCDISRRMTELSTQMASVVEKISEQSAGSTRQILDHAGMLTARSAEQLTQLLEHHSAEMAKVDDLKTTLDCTLRQFAGSIGRYGEITDNLEKLTSEVNATISSLAGITKSVAESQEVATRLLSSSSEQMEFLKRFSREQEELWDHATSSMTQYETVFHTIEGRAKELLSQIARHLGGYTAVTEKHFNLLTTTADNFIAQASGRLSGSIDELGEQLDELHNAVTKMNLTSRNMG